MGEHIDANKIVIIAEPKTIPFDLSEDVDNNFQHETDSTIKHNEFYAIVVQVQAWKRYSWTRKTVKPMNHTSLFQTCRGDQTYELRINMLFFKTYLFITWEKYKTTLQKQ